MGRFVTLLLVAALCSLPSAARAQTTGYWNGNANGNWTPSGAAWFNGLEPNGLSHTAYITNDITVNPVISLINGSVTVGILNLGDMNGGNVFTISGANTLNFGVSPSGNFWAGINPQLNKTTGGTDVISAPMAINSGNLIVNVTAGGLNLTGPISGTGGLTRYGSALLRIAPVSGATNTYSGITKIGNRGANDTNAQVILNAVSGNAIAGNIRIGDADIGGTGFAVLQLDQNRNVTTGLNQIADSSVLTFAGINSRWAYFKIMGQNETIGGIQNYAASGVIENMEGETINTNAVLTLNTASDLFYNGFIRNRAGGSGTGTLGITKTGTGTQTLSGGQISYTGVTDIQQGSLILENATAFNSASVTAASGATLGLSAQGANWTFGRTFDGVGANLAITGNPGTVVGSGNSVTITQALTHSGVTSITNATMALSTGSLVNTSGIVLNGGRFSLSATSADRINNAATFTSHGGVVAVSGSGFAESLGALQLASGQTRFTVTGETAGDTLTFANLTRSVGATANFTNAGDGPGAVSFSSVPPTPNGILGGWATFGNDFATLSGSSVVANTVYQTALTSASWAANENVKITLAGSVATQPSQTINSLILSGTTGTRTIDLGANVLTLASGGLMAVNDNIAIRGSSGTPTNGSLTSSSGELIVTVNGNTTNLNVFSKITGAVRLVKSGTGLLQLRNGANTFSGGITANEGFVSFRTEGDLGQNPGIVTANSIILNGGILRMEQDAPVATVALNANRGITLGPAGGIIGLDRNVNPPPDGQENVLTINGKITGSGRLTTAGGGVLVLNNAANDFSGGIQIGGANYTGSGGMVRIGNAGAVPAGTALNILAGTFEVFGNTVTVASLTGTGNITNGLAATPGKLIVNQTSNTTFSGQLMDKRSFDIGPIQPLSFEKSGIGVLNLTGGSTYTGSTTVSGGVLEVTSILNGGTQSGLGASSNAAANLVIKNGGALSYGGATPAMTDRSFTLGAGAEAGTITAKGTTRTAAIAFGVVGTSSLAFDGAGPRTLTLAGFNAGDNEFNVLLSDRIAAEPTSLYKIGSGVWWLRNPGNSYTGLTTVYDGRLVISANNALGAPGAGTSLLGGVLELRGVNYTGLERLAMDGGSVLVTPGTTSTWSGTVSFNKFGTLNVGLGATLNLPGSTQGLGRLVKAGEGTLVISGDNNALGAFNSTETEIQAGKLVLDYSSQLNSKLTNNRNLILGGGRQGATVELSGGASAHREIVGGLVLNTGNSQIIRTSGTSWLQLNNITRQAGGVINLGENDLADTDLRNTNGILGGWATLGGTDWAVNSGVTVVGLPGPGYVGPGYLGANDSWVRGLATVPGGGYLINQWDSEVADGVNPLKNTNVIANYSPTAGSNTNSLRFNTAASLTQTLQGDNSIVSGGILVTPAVGLNETRLIGSGSILRPGSTVTGSELVVHQNSPSGLLEIGSVVANTVYPATLFPGTTNSTNTTISGLSAGHAATLSVGMSVTGTNIPLGATITSIDTTNNRFTISANATGSGPVTNLAFSHNTSVGKLGMGSLLMSGENTYTGVTAIPVGDLWVRKLANGGLASGIGASSAAAANLVFDGGKLHYSGAPVSINRGFTINNAGGTLDLMHRDTTLTTTGGVAGAGIFSRSGVGTYQLSLATSQSAGGLLGWDLQDGSRTLWDFTADGARRVGDNRFANGNATMTFGGGSLRIDGATAYTNNNDNGQVTGTRIQTMAGNVNVNPGASSVHLVANGTVQPGTTTVLFLGNRDSADLVRPGGGTLHIVEDLNTNGGFGSAEFRMEVGSMNGNTSYVGNHGLGWATYSNIAGRADDFAYWFGQSSNGIPDVVAYGGAGGAGYIGQIVADWGVSTTAVSEGLPNPQIPTPGAGFTNTVIPDTAANIEFIRFASQTASTLNLPEFLAAFGSGFELYGESSILVSSHVGDNVKTIQGHTLSLYPASGLETSQPFDLYIHNWSQWGPNQGRLVIKSQIIDSSYPQAINLVLSGPGTTDLNPDNVAGNIYTGTTFLNDGYLLLSKDLALPGGIGATGGTSHLRISGDGVVLLGSNDFQRPLGTTADAVQFGGSGGFAAIGANRSVNLGGAGTPVGVTWGQGNFVPDSQVLILGAPQSGHTVSFLNPIHLGFKEREILTQNGTAVDDARLMGALSGGVNGMLNKTGAGRLVLNDTAAAVKSDYLGETHVYDGILQIETSTALGGSVGGTYVVPREETSVAGSTDSTTNKISNLPFSVMGTLSVGMKITGTHIPGSATITSVNPGDNSITISANAIGTGSVSDLAFATTVTLEIDGGAGNITSAETLWVSGNGDANNGVIRNIAGTNILQGAVTLSGNSSIGTDASTQLTLSGQITDGAGSFGMTKVGAGRLVLDDTAPILKSDYEGLTQVNQGIVQIRTDTALGSSVGGTTVSSGAAVELSPVSGSLVIAEAFTIAGSGVGGTGSLRNSGGNNEIQANVTLAANASIGVDPSSSLLLSRQVTGSFGLTKLGTGSLTLNDTGAGSPSNYTGVTDIQAGTVVVRTNTALGTTGGGTTVASGATLDLNPASGNLLLGEGMTLAGNGLGGVGSLRNSAGNNEIQANILLAQNASIGVNVGTSLTLSDGLADAGLIRNLNKVGLGSLILTDASTYGGLTTVEAGALVVNNTTGSGTGTGALMVNAGATLAGNGIVVPGSGASVTISPGSTLVVGSLTGSVADDLAITLSGGGDLVLGGTVEFQIFGNQSGFANPLLENDLLRVGAANWADILFGSNSVLKVTTTLDSTLWNGGDVWKLFDWTVLSGAIPTPSTNSVNYDLPSLAPGKFWDTTQLFTNGTVSIIPEPGRLGFLLMALIPMILRRRRRI